MISLNEVENQLHLSTIKNSIPTEWKLERISKVTRVGKAKPITEKKQHKL